MAQQQWFEKEDPGAAAKALFAWAEGIDSDRWQEKFDTLLYYRYATGRRWHPAFAFSIWPRPDSRANLFRATWAVPRHNVINQSMGTLRSRVFKERPFPLIVPRGGRREMQRIQAREQTRWLDGALEKYEIWPKVEQCTDDAQITGAGFMLVQPTKGKRIDARRIYRPEIYVDPAEEVTGEIRTMAIIVFTSRSELLHTYGADEKNKAAIEAAPKAHLAWAPSTLDTSDVIPVLLGWHTNEDDKGKRIVAVQSRALEFEAYDKEHFPIARLPFDDVGFFGQGPVEKSIPLQKELDRMMAAIWENSRRIGWPYILVPSDSGVADGDFGERSAGIIRYKTAEPKVVFPPWATPQQFEYIETLKRSIREQFRISEQASATAAPPPDMSGRARLIQDKIDDKAQTSLLQHLEAFAMRVDRLLCEAAAVVKPEVRAIGGSRRTIKWGDLDPEQVDVFPISNLPLSAEGKQDKVDRWFLEGRITKEQKNRLEQVPDTDAFEDLINAAEENVHQSIDEMLDTGEYSPPSGLGDPQAAKEIADARWLMEKTRGTKAERLDLVMRYSHQLQEMIDEAAPPAPVPGAPGMPPAPTPIAQPQGFAPQ